jgi:WD40 repeat protein
VLASAAHDGTVRLWSVGDGAAMQVLTVGAARPTAVAFSPDGSRLAVATVQAPVSVWDVKTGAKTATLSSSPPQSYGVAFSADGLRLATATRDPEHVVRVVDAVTGEVRATFPGTPAAHAVAFRPGADVVAFTDPVARVVVVWPVSAGAARTLTGHTDGPHALAFSPDGKALYSASARDGILRWDADTATLVARFERPPAG